VFGHQELNGDSYDISSFQPLQGVQKLVSFLASQLEVLNHLLYRHSRFSKTSIPPAKVSHNQPFKLATTPSSVPDEDYNGPDEPLSLLLLLDTQIVSLLHDGI